MKHILFIPGLGGESTLQRQRTLVKRANSKNKTLHFFEPDWHGDESSKDKARRLIEVIDSLPDEVHITGASAGGSLSVVAMSERPDKIASVKLACPKLQGSRGIGPSYDKRSPALKGNVQLAEGALENMPEEQLKRFTVYKPITEMVVPLRDMNYGSMKVRRLPLAGHIVTIAFCLIFFLRR